MRGEPESKIRGRAALIGFSGARADTKVEQLSGGEKARLLMGLATFDGPQLLILDEPTNHLDIDSRAELIEAINDYEGACILVSHDRRLLEACVDRLWLVANGTVKPFDGDLADYGRFVLGQGARLRRRSRNASSRAKPAPAPNRNRAQGPLQARTRRARGQDQPLPGSAAPRRQGAGGSKSVGRRRSAEDRRPRPAARRSRTRAGVGRRGVAGALRTGRGAVVRRSIVARIAENRDFVVVPRGLSTPCV